MRTTEPLSLNIFGLFSSESVFVRPFAQANFSPYGRVQEEASSSEMGGSAAEVIITEAGGAEDNPIQINTEM